MWHHPQSRKYIAVLSEEDWAMATGNMYRKFCEILWSSGKWFYPHNANTWQPYQGKVTMTGNSRARHVWSCETLPMTTTTTTWLWRTLITWLWRTLMWLWEDDSGSPTRLVSLTAIIWSPMLSWLERAAAPDESMLASTTVGTMLPHPDSTTTTPSDSPRNFVTIIYSNTFTFQTRSMFFHFSFSTHLPWYTLCGFNLNTA